MEHRKLRRQWVSACGSARCEWQSATRGKAETYEDGRTADEDRRDCSGNGRIQLAKVPLL